MNVDIITNIQNMRLPGDDTSLAITINHIVYNILLIELSQALINKISQKYKLIIHNSLI